MPRIVLAALAALILVLPATAEGQSGLRLRGTVALKVPAQGLVTVRAQRRAVVLHVPGSLARIRVGQRVELRGSTLRAHGNGSRVLARNVSVVRSQPLAQSSSPTPAPHGDDEIGVDDDEDDDDNCGPGNVDDDDDDDDSSGPGNIDDDDGDNDNCGPGNVDDDDDDDDDDSSGPGGGGDDDD